MTDFVVLGTRLRVEAWAARRLPFEPRGSALELRIALRERIASLEADGFLRCVYASADRTFCDTENVLLYNVGMSTFARLAKNGLVFERSFHVPPPPTGEPLAHYHSYATSELTGFDFWEPLRIVSSWRTAVPAKRSSAAAWWRAVADGVPAADGGLDAQPFGLRIRMGTDVAAIHSMLKPMLDGTIAALHSDPAPTSIAVDRVAVQLGLSAESVSAMLLADGPLGSRVALVRSYRDGVQWNPADDLCVACSVVVDPRVISGSLEGELVEVRPVSL